jgi:hypothetical protein
MKRDDMYNGSSFAITVDTWNDETWHLWLSETSYELLREKFEGHFSSAGAESR